jgi:predicted transcriptional regulator
MARKTKKTPPWDENNWPDFNHYDKDHYTPEYLFQARNILVQMFNPWMAARELGLYHLFYIADAAFWEVNQIDRMLYELGYIVENTNNQYKLVKLTQEVRDYYEKPNK